MEWIIDVPYWDPERRGLILMGQEVVAVLEPGEDEWLVKTVRCSTCGKCCQAPMPARWPFGTQVMDGVEVCALLTKTGDEYWCQNPYKPLSCIQEQSDLRPHEDCPIEYEKM